MADWTIFAVNHLSDDDRRSRTLEPLANALTYLPPNNRYEIRRQKDGKLHVTMKLARPIAWLIQLQADGTCKLTRDDRHRLLRRPTLTPPTMSVREAGDIILADARAIARV